MVIHLPHAHSVTHALFVRSGPRYEQPDENGISHLLEHLLFRGTRSHPTSLEFNIAVETLGGEVNGMTQRDATAIHVTVPPKAAARGLELLGEVCTEPLLSGIDIERDVVIEEILDTQDGEGHELDIDTISKQILWEGHPMGMAVAGEPSLVEHLSEAACRQHFERTFVANNAVLCIAGRVDEQEMFETAHRAFHRMPQGRALVEPPPPVPQSLLPIHVQASEDSQVCVLLSYPAPHENDPEFGALLLLKRILDDGFASRLRQAICEQGGLAYSLAASIDAYRDLGAFDVELSCAPQKVMAAAHRMLVTLDQLAQGAIDDEELKRAKTRHLAELEFALDDPNELAAWYGTSELMDCRIGYKARLGEVLATQASDIQALAKKMFTREAALLTLVGPVEESDLRQLEMLLGRSPHSTVWIGTDEEDDESPHVALAAGQ